jgi:hypothetical protein
MGNEDFNKAELESEIEFEVVGSQFKQKDVEIIIVGKLLTLKEPEVVVTQPVETTVPVVAPAQEGEKQVVITASTEPEKKKRKLKKGGGEDAPTFETLPAPPV